MEQKPKYLLIVKVPKGVASRRTPRPESQGGLLVRNIAVGTALYAYDIINVDGVNYASIIPLSPTIPEWVRVAEKDHSVEYVDVIPLTASSEDGFADLAKSINSLADSIRLLANSK